MDIDWKISVNLSSSELRRLKTWSKVWQAVVEKQLVQKKILNFSLKSSQIGLWVCGDQKMRVLNKLHRNKNKTTDVLSFPYEDNLRLKKELNLQSKVWLGEVVICHPKCVGQAKKFKLSYEEEFFHLLTHGFLHLLGFDHELNLKEESLMEKKEKLILLSFKKLRSRRSKISTKV